MVKMRYVTIIDGGGWWTETRDEAIMTIIGRGAEKAQLVDTDLGRYSQYLPNGDVEHGWLLTKEEIEKMMILRQKVEKRIELNYEQYLAEKIF